MTFHVSYLLQIMHPLITISSLIARAHVIHAVLKYTIVVLGSLQANTETDGRLNYKEVIENPFVFVHCYSQRG